MIIRDESPTDFSAITEVTRQAFRIHPFSHQTEHHIITALRADQALAISLVAEIQGQVVGHIAFSPITISDGSRDWYGVGPLSVSPEWQKQGIGRALVEEGLSRLRSIGARGCLLVGDPNFYNRFGFCSPPGLTLEGVPPEVFLGLTFGDEWPAGAVAFHPGFGATGDPGPDTDSSA